MTDVGGRIDKLHQMTSICFLTLSAIFQMIYFLYQKPFPFLIFSSNQFRRVQIVKGCQNRKIQVKKVLHYVSSESNGFFGVK